MKWLHQFFSNVFHGNPLIADTGNYLEKFRIALSTWLKGVIALIALAFVGIIGFVIGALNHWF